MSLIDRPVAYRVQIAKTSPHAGQHNPEHRLVIKLPVEVAKDLAAVAGTQASAYCTLARHHDPELNLDGVLLRPLKAGDRSGAAGARLLTTPTEGNPFYSASFNQTAFDFLADLNPPWANTSVIGRITSTGALFVGFPSVEERRPPKQIFKRQQKAIPAVTVPTPPSPAPPIKVSRIDSAVQAALKAGIPLTMNADGSFTFGTSK